MSDPAAQIAELTEELRHAKAALAATQAELAAVGKQITALEAENARLDAKVIGAWDEMRRIRHSFSWRLTAPLRVFRRLLP